MQLLTIVISNNHTSDDLYHTLNSLARSAAERSPQVLVLGEDASFHRDRIGAVDLCFVKDAKPNDMSSYAEALRQAKGDYILFADSGDLFADNFYDVIDRFEKNTASLPVGKRKNVAVMGFETIAYDRVPKLGKKGFKASPALSTETVNLRLSPEDALTETTGVLLRTEALREIGIDENCTLDGLKLAAALLAGRNSAYLRINNLLLKTCYPTTADAVNFANMHKPEWYFNSLERYVLPMLRTVAKNGRAKDFVQYIALYELIYRYLYNQNNSDKHIVDQEFDRFRELCADILKLMDNSIIFNMDNALRYRVPTGVYHALFNTKYGPDIESKYVYDKKNILRLYQDIVLMRARSLKVILEVLEYEDGKLRIEASVDSFMDMKNVSLKCCLNNREKSLTETYRYAHTKFFGVSTNKRYTFRIIIDDSELQDANNLTFFLCHGDFRVQLPMVTRHYTSKVSSAVSYSYWMYGADRRAVYFSDSCQSLTITRMSKAQRLLRELKLLLFMLIGFDKTPGMFFTRLMYWLTRPYFSHKRIWLTYDKLYKGGDCGEYFYKYMKTRAKQDGIIPAYVINRDAADLKRLHKEGYRPLKFNSLKNRLYYINAEAVFATHGGVASFNGISNSRVKFVSDLLFAEVTCIQHGLSVQQLAQELNQVYNNTKRYYCASKYEIKNLERPIYGYEDHSALRLTGVPRYDGLRSNDQKQILITPTWRAYISMPPVMGHSRPYYPEFKNTNYYKFYYNLLTDSRLVATARRTGYRLIYLLHPIISSQIVDYPDIDGVEIIPATTVNYEKILTESSLMLTDYSGVQFDFAYMRKPVVYYHPPELPPHYKEGGFFYDTMGFGEICTTHDEMVNCLCEYMENGCRIKPFYKDRADDFFAYSDYNSCERIYDDFTEYISAKRAKR